MIKLITPLIQSQRDGRWSGILLGYNTSSVFNIGNYGCLITSLGNYVGKTPIEVNQILKDNGGFTEDSGNFIWSKCTTIGLNAYYTSPRYDDEVTSQGITKMKSLLNEGRPLLCEIDFNPATIAEDMHYVLVIGYDETQTDKFIAIDPWTGTEIDLAVYGGVKRTLYCFRAYDKVLPFYTIAVSDDTFKKKIQAYFNTEVTADDVIKFINERKAEISKLNQAITDKDVTITNLNGQIAQLEKDKNTLADELKICQQAGEVNIELNNKLIQSTQELNQMKLDYEQSKSNWQLKEVTYNKQISLLTTKYNATKSSVKKLLVDYIFGKA